MHDQQQLQDQPIEKNESSTPKLPDRPEFQPPLPSHKKRAVIGGIAAGVVIAALAIGAGYWFLLNKTFSGPKSTDVTQRPPVTGFQSSGTYGSSSSPSTNGSLAIRVAGNRLVNAAGKPVQLVGVNITAGGDCIPIGNQPLGVIYPLTQTTQVATLNGLRNWHVNVVRLTMNEDCWLGINNVNAQYSGANYRNQILAFVNALTQNNIYVDVDMHTNAPGSYVANSQQVMADADHAPAFWQSVAAAFKGNPAVLFELYNEPHLTTSNAQTSNPWNCWRDGCTASETDETANKPIPGAPNWQTAGMQSLVNAVRSSGATNPILLGGLNWSQDLSQFLQYLPSDSDHQLIAAYHNYVSTQSKNSLSYWNAVIAPVAQQLPVITSEFGEKDGGTNIVTQYLGWADTHNVSYIAWAWVPNSVFDKLGLVSSLDGTPSPYGQILYTHYRSINP